MLSLSNNCRVSLMLSVCFPFDACFSKRYDGLCHFGGCAVLAAGDRAENRCCEAEHFLDVATLVSGAFACLAIFLDRAMEIRWAWMRCWIRAAKTKQQRTHDLKTTLRNLNGDIAVVVSGISWVHRCFDATLGYLGEGPRRQK